jgi:hypothetical protein
MRDRTRQRRRGKNDDSRSLLVHIKFSVEDSAGEVRSAALRAESVEEVIAAFFGSDEDQNKRFLGMGAVPIDEEWEGKHMIKISSLSKMRVVKLAKVKLLPRAKGLFDAEFRITVEQPPEICTTSKRSPTRSIAR